MQREEDFLKKKLAYPYEKIQTLESFCKPLNLRREDCSSTSKQSCPVFTEIIRTQAINVEKKTKNPKELTTFYLKIDVLLLFTDFFPIYKVTCKEAYGINSLYSYSTPSSKWEAGRKKTAVQLDYVTDDRLRILLENKKRGGPNSCMERLYVKRGERKTTYEATDNLYD